MSRMANGAGAPGTIDDLLKPNQVLLESIDRISTLFNIKKIAKVMRNKYKFWVYTSFFYIF